MQAQLEHINIAVPDAGATADILITLFGWHICWQGDPNGKGYSVHVGTTDRYIALYSPIHAMQGRVPKYRHYNGLNHIGVTVDDIDAAETDVRAAGYIPHTHGDYEPGRRFYFDGPDGVEYEIVSYA